MRGTPGLSFAARCRKETHLSAMQIGLLSRMEAVFPFLADLVHGDLKAYVPAAKEGFFLLAAHIHPHTVYMAGAKETGRLVRRIEEPIIAEAFQAGQAVSGKREWTYGTMRDMHVFPILSEGRVLCALAFEVDAEKLLIEGYPRLLEAARVVLLHAQKACDLAPFAPIQAGDGILITDARSRIVFADVAARRIYRVLGVGSLVGCPLYERQLTRHVTRETVERDRPWRKEIEAGGLSLVRREVAIREGGTLCLRIVLLSDVTETRARDEALRIKSAIIQEVHHRVKNNLQMVASLLRLQARRASSEEVRLALRESVNRILSISVVHEYLSQQGDEAIDVQEVFGHIFGLVVRSMADKGFSVRTACKGERLVLPSKCASSVALVLNELVLNAMEHAFIGRSEGLIGLSVKAHADGWLLDFYDDGIGLPKAFDIARTKSLGLTIVKTLIEGDLGGQFSIAGEAGCGTHARIILPKMQPDSTA